MKIKNAIYPTIKNKFDALTATYISDHDRFHFVDNKLKNRLLYDRRKRIIAIDMDYFMLRYFGIDSYSYNEDVSGTFMKILKDFLGEQYRDYSVSHNDVFYTTNKNL
jgi:hypothetical protein